MSIRWHDNGVPFQPSSRAQSRSDMPGRRPVRTWRTPFEVWHAAHSKAASWSTSLITRSPVGGIDQEVGGVLHHAVRGRRPELVDQEGRGLDGRPAGVGLPADDADPAGAPDPCVAQDRTQRHRRVAGLARKAQVLEGDQPHRQRGRGRHRAALVADEDGGLARRRDEQHRLLEAWVEPGEVGEVGAVLPVGPHDEVVVAAGGHRLPQAVQPLGVHRRREQRFGVGQADVGERDLRHARRRVRRHHAITMPRRRRCRHGS